MTDQYPWLKHLESIAGGIVSTLHEKEKAYGGSWQKRGGPGAFMMLARKWDRIENMVSSAHYDIFELVKTNHGDIIDDIDDLIGYLLLVRAKAKADILAAADRKMISSMEPGPGYVNQDPDIESRTTPNSTPHSTGYIDWEKELSPPLHPKHKPLSGEMRSGVVPHKINTTPEI